MVSFLLICANVNGQGTETPWYSESENNGVIIQNSYPKGGLYKGSTKRNYHHSYLVFFTRISNESENSIALSVNFSADSIAIPDSPDTYVQLFLPQDTMTLDKQNLANYGITELESFVQSTSLERKLKPKEDCLFYVVAIFFQTKAGAWNQERGGNRAELVLRGQNLFYNMPPQIDLQRCGRIIFNN